MLPILLLVVSLSSPFAQEVQHAYAHDEADALSSLLAEADSRADSLLVRYRLYPLTEDASVLDGLPSDLPNGSARERALLSGLWAYRAGAASVFRTIHYGRRSAQLLERAKAQDADDPYVLLIEGQSLLFRPALAGRDVEAAEQCFDRLVAQGASAAGIPAMEARVWRWLALTEAGQSEAAQTLRQRLMDRNPAPLYRQFLEAPPDV